MHVRFAALSIIVAVFVAVGCSGPGKPRNRIGALPFPGPFTLYGTSDPSNMGVHRSSGFPPYPVGPYEQTRGIMYTTQAGFMDVAHIRYTIDWTRYATKHVRQAMRDKKTKLVLSMNDHATFHLVFHPISGLDTMTPADREALQDELAIRMGQQIAYLSMTFHEVQTWYGYKTAGLISEKPSAFTYDDLMSHVFGVDVAGEAMREVGIAVKDDAFDAAVTKTLDVALREVGAVAPADTRRAITAVDGSWWKNGRPIKRQLDAGLSTGIFHPWLVPGFVPKDEKSATVIHQTAGGGFPLPSLLDVQGRDLTGCFEVTIEPRSWEAGRIRSVVPGKPKLLEPARDLPFILEDIRTDLHKHVAPDADRISSLGGEVAGR